MACLRCGSGWVTKNGKDKVSCPECCKQQRAKARRLGRLPASQAKVCERCGDQFEAIGGNAIARSTKCRACVQNDLASRVRQKRYQAKVKAGLKIPCKRAAKSLHRECSWCHKALNTSNQRKYCSNKCFVNARNAGQQSWDRTAQLASNVRRCGIQLTPSRRGLSKILNGFKGFMVKLQALRRRINRLHCLTCDSPVLRDSSRFCCEECCASYKFKTECRACGKYLFATGYRGRKTRTCRQCKKKANRRWKRSYGGNHSSRARHHGVKYVSFPKRMIFERDNYKCQLCGSKTLQKVMYRKKDGKIHPRSPTVDCIVAMENGGNYEPSNCQTACFICNSKKGARNRGQLRLALK